MSALQYISMHQRSQINSMFTLKFSLQPQIHLTDGSYARGLYSVPEVTDLIKLHVRSCPPWLGLHPGIDDISSGPTLLHVSNNKSVTRNQVTQPHLLIWTTPGHVHLVHCLHLTH